MCPIWNNFNRKNGNLFLLLQTRQTRIFLYIYIHKSQLDFLVFFFFSWTSFFSETTMCNAIPILTQCSGLKCGGKKKKLRKRKWHRREGNSGRSYFLITKAHLHCTHVEGHKSRGKSWRPFSLQIHLCYISRAFLSLPLNPLMHFVSSTWSLLEMCWKHDNIFFPNRFSSLLQVPENNLISPSP